MHLNKVKEKLRNNQPVIGPFIGLQSPHVAELFGYAGFDFVVIECEHNALDAADVEHMLMAIGNTEAVPLVRVPHSDEAFIQRSLDSGAQGIMVPMVKTAEEAETLVRATRYPGEGTRSWGGLRPSKYTLSSQDYLKHSNENMIVVLIIETLEAIQNLDSITDVDGIDVLIVGTWDLCLALGLDPSDQPHVEVENIVENVMHIATKKGISVGAGATNPQEIKEAISKGAGFIHYGPDYTLLSNAAKEGISVFRELTKR